MGYRTFIFPLLMSAVLTGLAGAADLPAQPNIERGKELATKLCARCHAVGLDDTSTIKQATPFRLFQAKWPLEYLEEALAEGIVTGHEEMPEFTFKPDQILALLAYINQLTPK